MGSAVAAVCTRMAKQKRSKHPNVMSNDDDGRYQSQVVVHCESVSKATKASEMARLIAAGCASVSVRSDQMRRTTTRRRRMVESVVMT